MTLATMIVDDEPLARRRLRRLLESCPEVRIVAEADSGEAAIDRLGRLPTIALLILDIQMGGLDGFGVLDGCDPVTRPEVIFVTAHDQHAIRAFDRSAVHYLLKPVDPERLREAVARAAERVAARGNRPPESRFIARIPVVVGPRLVPVPIGEIEWIEAAGNYVKLHCPGRSLLHRTPMTALEEQLPPDRFVRIHRSTIVAIDRVAHATPLSTGDLIIGLKSGQTLRMSRNHRDALDRIMTGR